MKKTLISLFIVFCICLSYCSCFAQNVDYYSVIYREIERTNPSLGSEGIDWTTRAILWSSNKWNVDPILVTAMFKQESGFSMNAISPVGAVGIAQLMPSTAEGLGVNPYNALENIDGGVHYLKIQLDRFSGSGDWMATYAVAAYNAGPGAIQKYGGVPPYNETIDYVNSISAIYNQIIKG